MSKERQQNWDKPRKSDARKAYEEQENAGRFAGDKEAAAVLLGASRWVALDDRQSFGEMAVTQQIDNGTWKVSLLLDPERERDSMRETPEVRLIRLAEGQEPVVDILLQHGADPKMKDKDNDTAAKFAEDSGFNGLAQKLQALIDAP